MTRRPPTYIRERLEREAILRRDLRRAGVIDPTSNRERADELERRFQDIVNRGRPPADQPPF